MIHGGITIHDEPIATEYEIAKLDELRRVTVNRMGQIDGSIKWKVSSGSRCLNCVGEWEYEPMPSSRDDAFLARCRFDTLDKAVRLARLALTDAVSEMGRLAKS